MWNDVELLVNEDSGNVRFGSISAEENGSSLYQLDTLVKVSSNEVQPDPHLYSITGNNWSVLVADKTVVLFSQRFQTVLLLLHFESDVDAIDVCLEGEFLLVCERNGNLHLIFVPLKKILLTKALVVKPNSGDRKTYCALITEESKVSQGLYHVFLVIKDGFFHIINLNLVRIKTAIENMDMATLKELQSVIKIDFCSTEMYHNKGCGNAVAFTLANEIHLFIGGDGEHAVTHWIADSHESKMCLAHSMDNSLIAGVKKMVVVENVLYILDTEEVLSRWDGHFLVMVHIWPDVALLDFEIITECGSAALVEGAVADSQAKGSVKMITLEKQNKSQINSLRIRCLPSMAVCYCLDVSSVSCLVQKNISMDTIYLVEGICTTSESCSSRGESVSSLIVRCLTETLPENRLSRLLHKQRFEEAEQFAALFELDLELVYKVKLAFLLEQLASASVGDCGQDEWSELVEEARINLLKIADEKFVVDYCIKCPWPTFDTAEKMLSLAATHSSSLQIHEALARLATFCSLHGPDKFNGIDWIEFLNSSDMLGDVLSRLRDGDLWGAQLLWLKYEGHIAGRFDESKLEAVLDAIPEDLPSGDLCPWFKNVFLPFVRRVLPSGQKMLAKWIEQRARNLELMEKGAWPQNGLALAELGLPPLWLWLKSDDYYASEEVENLRTLVCNLRQLLELHTKYNCSLSLSLFEKGKVRSVAFLMLDKAAAPNLIAATVENHILPYADEHGILLDELLLQYIKDMLENCSSQTNTLFTAWEAKAVAVLGCMVDMDLKVDAVLAIMQKAVFPWNTVVEDQIQLYLEMEGPKQELLKESYRLMEIRKLLWGYGIRSCTLSSPSYIMAAVRYILKQDSPTCLQDTIALAEAYKLPTSHINYLYLVRLIGQGQSDACVTALKSLPYKEVTCVMKRLTSWALLKLEEEDHLSDEHKKEKMVIAQVMVEALKYQLVILKDEALQRMESENSLHMFKTIARLQEDFDIFLTPTNYEDADIQKEIREHHIAAHERARSARPSAAISTDADLRRLGRSLQCSEQELWSDMALRALGTGNVQEALHILSELYEHHNNTGTGKVLFTAAKTLCHMLESDVPMVLPDDTDLPAVIYHLACQASTVCHPDLLLDCVELCKSTRLAMDIYHQCQISDSYGFVAKDFATDAEKDPSSQWCFQDVFHEDCIILDPVSVLPVQYEITHCLIPVSQDSKLYPLDCSCLSHCSFKDGFNYLQPLLSPLLSMLQMLQECSQLELALRVLVNSYGSCLQHVTSNVMDLKISAQLYDVEEMRKYNVSLNELRKITNSSLNSIAVALLNKVFNWRMVDCHLAIGLCTLLSKEEVLKILWKVIDNTWENYERILAVARVGVELCGSYNHPEEKNKFLSVITDAEWGIKLAKIEISIQPVFHQPAELIPVLVKNKKITPEIILQYCRTYGLDSDNVINQYVTTVLLSHDEEGEGQAQVLCHAEALERALGIIPKLRQTHELISSLSAAIFKLSPYNYEKIEVVLKLLLAADENVAGFSASQAFALLQHLKSYKRLAPPSDVEHAYLLENNSLPPTPLDAVRLPFHLLLQKNHYWKIISPELSEKTFPTLLLISKLMKVSLDKLYVLAVNHIFDAKIKPLVLEQSKRAQAAGKKKEIQKLAMTLMRYILCIKNQEWAAATALKITQELPPGYEKTQSLRFCLAIGKTWLAQPDIDDAMRTRGEAFTSKLHLQLRCSATVSALMATQLNTAEYLKLSGAPDKLITALYEHSSVEQRFRDSGGHAYPDIHAVVKEIVTINQVDLLKIHNMLLEKWLCKTGSVLAKDNIAQECVRNVKDDIDLMRVVHMLQSQPTANAVCLLSSILTAETWPLSKSGPRLTSRHRTRALLCLVRLADADTLEAQLKIPREDLDNYLKCYIFVSWLEALNIPYTVRSFLSSPKEGLIKGLWKNHSHEPQAVCLVADLCLEYKVYDPQLWNGLLQKMLCFNLISDLQKVLEAVVAVPVLWEISSFSRAWKSLLLAPFITASLPLSVDQQATFHRNFVLLLKCPLLLNMDLIRIAKGFAQFNLLAFALGTLLLIPCVSKKDQQVQAFLCVHDPLAVLEQEEKLMNTGEFAGIPSQIRDTVLTYMMQHDQHVHLVKTNHFTHMKKLMAINGQPEKVKDLINYLISHNCQEDAHWLAQEYMKHRQHGNATNQGLQDLLTLQNVR
ncbi:kinetochore-associated protein 1 isoform X1 [Syngnathus scovelli]|uniref:kinetochore-associated protein 1 isoform X1 n=1 Tax=Syngnathus scovelli TaxID=161590 RepID=UPI00210F65E9|nr:kinetochore-associated protein 1 isoform X1 [Syngnathus scovelli]XP_049618953.1 kinetochore-associated protein 1 isoform X1 [Syngnathus scovelli]